jgi:hypothetical protein
LNNNKLYNILSELGKVEQNRLRKYIYSPYFNANEILGSFYTIIISHFNENKKTAQLKKELVWKLIYPKEAFNDSKFRKLCSDLIKLVEGFLAQQVYDKNEMQQSIYLLEAIQHEKIEPLYKTSKTAAETLALRQHIRPASYYQYLYQMEINVYELEETDLKRSEKSNIEEIINNLDNFYLAEKIKWYNSFLSRKNTVSYEYNVLFINEIIDHLQKNNDNLLPAVKINYLVLLTKLKQEDESHFFNLKNELALEGNKFPPNELYSFYLGALNYCISKINQGNQSFLREYHNLYTYLLENGIIFRASKDGTLSPWSFKNIVLAALRLGEYEWIEKFIQTYKDRLPIEFRGNAVSYNLAQVYFYQKKYDKAKALLQEVEYVDVAYNLDAKSMLMAIYFELDEDDSLISLMDSFKVYLSRHKDIPDQRKDLYLGLIKFIKRLMKLLPEDIKSINQLHEEIEATEGVASKKWLLEKLEELK